MFNDFKIILDLPPRRFFESSHDEKVGWVYVFFHGWANVEIIRLSQPGGSYGSTNNPNALQKWGDKTKDKEILFQNHVKVYAGYDKLHKKTPYEWPFNFSFQAETASAYNLPSSGHYSFIRESNWLSSVKYKVVAVHGEIGQRDDDIRWMLNPKDPRYLREPALKPTGIFLKIKERLGGATEQELKFVQIRASSAVDPYLPPANSWELYIEGKHVPQLAPPARYNDLQNQKTTFPFSVDLQLPSNVVIGEPFKVQLSVSSSSTIWNQNPPAVILKSFKMKCYILDIITIGEQRADEKLKSRTVWEGKRLNIPLDSHPVDIGTLYSFSIEGEEIIQSFDTQTLHRAYNFPVELTVEVGGKTFEARYGSTRRVTLLSPYVAIGGPILENQPQPNFRPIFRQDSKHQFQESPVKVQLQGTYIGRLSHDGAGLDRPLAEHSMMEAAIALSRTLTEAGIQHVFPGGTMIKLLPYDFSQIINDKKIRSSGTDGENLRRLFEKSFRVMEAEERYPVSLHIGMTDQKHRENISIEFPSKSFRQSIFQLANQESRLDRFGRSTRKVQRKQETGRIRHEPDTSNSFQLPALDPRNPPVSVRGARNIRHRASDLSFLTQSPNPSKGNKPEICKGGDEDASKFG
jgi:hypothetical protein